MGTDSNTTEPGYMVAVGGSQYGPHSLAEINAMLASGMIEPSAQIWTAGWTEWATIGVPQTAAAIRKPALLAKAVPHLQKHKIAYLAAGAATLVLVSAIIAAYEYGKERQRDEIRDAIVSAISRADKPAVPDPKFTLEPANHTIDEFTWRGWAITNTDTAPLVVHCIIYNGERTANLGFVHPSGAVMDTTKSGDVTLGIGQTQTYFQSLSLTVTPGTYSRDIVFIDVYTGRGDFRYEPYKGFSADKPVYDAQRIHNEDARAVAAAEQAERAGQNAPVQPKWAGR